MARKFMYTWIVMLTKGKRKASSFCINILNFQKYETSASKPVLLDRVSGGKYVEEEKAIQSFFVFLSFSSLRQIFLPSLLEYTKSVLLLTCESVCVCVCVCVFVCMLCILTSEEVLRMPFSGENQFFDAKTTFYVLFSHKM